MKKVTFESKDYLVEKMTGSLNKVMLIGNLGKDPETVSFDNGGKIIKFPIATSENYSDKEGQKKEFTEWHNIVFRSPRLVEVCELYLKKGDKVFIEGKIRSRQWNDENNKTRYSFEIAGDSMTMLGPNRGNQNDVNSHKADDHENNDLPF